MSREKVIVILKDYRVFDIEWDVAVVQYGDLAVEVRGFRKDADGKPETTDNLTAVFKLAVTSYRRAIDTHNPAKARVMAEAAKIRAKVRKAEKDAAGAEAATPSDAVAEEADDE